MSRASEVACAASSGSSYSGGFGEEAMGNMGRGWSMEMGLWVEQPVHGRPVALKSMLDLIKC